MKSIPFFLILSLMTTCFAQKTKDEYIKEIVLVNEIPTQLKQKYLEFLDNKSITDRSIPTPVEWTDFIMTKGV